MYQESELKNHLKEELSDCKTYIHMYEVYGDEFFVSIAIDELQHASVMIDLMNRCGYTIDDVLVAEFNNLKGQLFQL